MNLNPGKSNPKNIIGASEKLSKSIEKEKENLLKINKEKNYWKSRKIIKKDESIYNFLTIR